MQSTPAELIALIVKSDIDTLINTSLATSVMY